LLIKRCNFLQDLEKFKEAVKVLQISAKNPHFQRKFSDLGDFVFFKLRPKFIQIKNRQTKSFLR
jgi:hypothetical protein